MQSKSSKNYLELRKPYQISEFDFKDEKDKSFIINDKSRPIPPIVIKEGKFNAAKFQLDKALDLKNNFPKAKNGPYGYLSF